jgi:hypothetical protein
MVFQMTIAAWGVALAMEDPANLRIGSDRFLDFRVVPGATLLQLCSRRPVAPSLAQYSRIREG